MTDIRRVQICQKSIFDLFDLVNRTQKLFNENKITFEQHRTEMTAHNDTLHGIRDTIDSQIKELNVQLSRIRQSKKYFQQSSLSQQDESLLQSIPESMEQLETILLNDLASLESLTGVAVQMADFIAQTTFDALQNNLKSLNVDSLQFSDLMNQSGTDNAQQHMIPTLNRQSTPSLQSSKSSLDSISHAADDLMHEPLSFVDSQKHGYDPEESSGLEHSLGPSSFSFSPTHVMTMRIDPNKDKTSIVSDRFSARIQQGTDPDQDVSMDEQPEPVYQKKSGIQTCSFDATRGKIVSDGENDDVASESESLFSHRSTSTNTSSKHSTHSVHSSPPSEPPPESKPSIQPPFRVRNPFTSQIVEPSQSAQKPETNDQPENTHADDAGQGIKRSRPTSPEDDVPKKERRFEDESSTRSENGDLGLNETAQSPSSADRGEKRAKFEEDDENVEEEEEEEVMVSPTRQYPPLNYFTLLSSHTPTIRQKRLKSKKNGKSSEENKDKETEEDDEADSLVLKVNSNYLSSFSPIRAHKSPITSQTSNDTLSPAGSHGKPAIHFQLLVRPQPPANPTAPLSSPSQSKESKDRQMGAAKLHFLSKSPAKQEQKPQLNETQRSSKPKDRTKQSVYDRVFNDTETKKEGAKTDKKKNLNTTYSSVFNEMNETFSSIRERPTRTEKKNILPATSQTSAIKSEMPSPLRSPQTVRNDQLPRTPPQTAQNRPSTFILPSSQSTLRTATLRKDVLAFSSISTPQPTRDEKQKIHSSTPLFNRTSNL
ncbi:hypothetical protein BLNAU_9448 [Blattamonas nauphoetae]|uniref:Shugoshin C-terminal domain-containing protein n=1 Tax=Blattamonas nauphoetae TaxID=2049346 RepID=A0ABQ9XVS6_9EUKA|nr:hypothetical protein BLNAU_9448 [Blattamonas nauphoetae]